MARIISRLATILFHSKPKELVKTLPGITLRRRWCVPYANEEPRFASDSQTALSSLHSPVVMNEREFVLQISIKVGHLGMNVQPFGSDYCVYRNQTIPLRWLPAEAVLEDEYSTKSDVWSFAVTVWELYHAGKQPFAGRSDESLLAELGRPKSAIWTSGSMDFCKSNTLTSLLSRCWSHDPLLRPSFDEVLAVLTGDDR